MKSPLFILFVILSIIALALAVKVPPKSVVFTYPSTTPDHILDEAKQAIIKAGGMITHEYLIFKGFAATGPAKAFELAGTMAQGFDPTIEEDQIVSING